MGMMAEAVDRWRAALRAVDVAWTKFHKVSLGGRLDMQEASEKALDELIYAKSYVHAVREGEPESSWDKADAEAWAWFSKMELLMPRRKART